MFRRLLTYALQTLKCPRFHRLLTCTLRTVDTPPTPRFRVLLTCMHFAGCGTAQGFLGTDNAPF